MAPQLDIIERLRAGRVEVVGRLPWSSNITFVVDVHDAAQDGEALRAIYKPEAGEQPLWDFPGGIHRREVAAYALSTALGWPNIPETVARDGPHGVGSLQRFIDADFEQHYFTFGERPELHSTLIALAAFDVVTNNTDRKSGHCLLANDHEVWAIDNNLSFHVEPKLRTVIWEFQGAVLPGALVDDLRRVATDLPGALDDLLADEEVAALRSRMQALAEHPVLPHLQSQRQYPWPLV